MAELAVKLAHPPTLADIDALPPHMKGETINGVPSAMTRPRGAHQSVAGAIHADSTGPFSEGVGVLAGGGSCRSQASSS